MDFIFFILWLLKFLNIFMYIILKYNYKYIHISIYFYDINLIPIIYIIIFIIFKILKNSLVLILILSIAQSKYEDDQLYLLFLKMSISIKFRDYFVILITRKLLSTYERHLSSRDATININYWYLIDTNVISIISLKYQQL